MPNSATLPLPTPRRRRSWAVRLAVFGLAAVVLAAGLGLVVWWKFFRSEPQPLADERARFHYDSPKKTAKNCRFTQAILSVIKTEK